MKTKIMHDVYGEIVYDESFWSGKKRISVDGKTLTKSKRNIYVYQDPNTSLTVVLKGSVLFGLTMTINHGAEITIASPPKWYEIVIAVCILCIGIVLGNSPFAAVFPLVGGALGGAISGVMAVLALMVVKPIPKVPVKLLVGIGLLALTFFICHIVGLLFLAALT